MAARIIALFNLKPGVSVADYEAWAKAKDLPTVNGLGSVANFEVFRSAGLLMGEGKPPYEYVEIIDVADMDKFGADVSTPGMQAIAAEFGAFADAVFIMTEKLDWTA
ncbi:hypothetical protein [Caulobacter segnis]|uniref:REDY-like protein HapK n=1 Tax=Caulobacter segnis TaxID=88688 RepID=A0A2W5VGE2_9CAUL|nr:hypothetical protein [Caulobacter segnis]PZR36933.1 MAG: REDY-like protein HapK [Caulobacter segnis]